MKALKKENTISSNPDSVDSIVSLNHVFEYYSSVTRTITVSLKHRTEAIFKIDKFVTSQLIQGVIVLHKNKKDSNMSTYFVTDLLIKLSTIMFSLSKTSATLLTHEQAMFLKKALEARMKHCEKELENRVMIDLGPNEKKLKFNKETYVSMKILLLDIREWLIGEIVE